MMGIGKISTKRPQILHYILGSFPHLSIVITIRNRFIFDPLLYCAVCMGHISINESSLFYHKDIDIKYTCIQYTVYSWPKRIVFRNVITSRAEKVCMHPKKYVKNVHDNALIYSVYMYRVFQKKANDSKWL